MSEQNIGDVVGEVGAVGGPGEMNSSTIITQPKSPVLTEVINNNNTGEDEEGEKTLLILEEDLDGSRTENGSVCSTGTAEIVTVNGSGGGALLTDLSLSPKVESEAVEENGSVCGTGTAETVTVNGGGGGAFLTDLPLSPEVESEALEENGSVCGTGTAETVTVNEGGEGALPDLQISPGVESIVVEENGSVCSTASTEESINEIHEIMEFTWSSHLTGNPHVYIAAAPVENFRHVLLCEEWEELVRPGLFVEYEVAETTDNKVGYWIGRIEEIQGYLVKVLPVGALGLDSRSQKKLKNKPFVWLNLLKDCTRVGVNSTRNGCFLCPPTVQEDVDWKKVLFNQMRKKDSISRHLDTFYREQTAVKMKEGLEFEVVDTRNVSQFKVAKLKKIIGDRFYFKYWDDDEPDSHRDGFWCHSESRLFRPKGWCEAMGIKLDAPPTYRHKKLPPGCLLEEEKVDPNSEVEVGMKLECIDPVVPLQICTATVIKVLKYGFMLIRCDHADEDFDPDVPNNDSMYVHVSSNLIFECGFADAHGIRLMPPNEYENKRFSWNEYLAETEQKPVKLPKRHEIKKKFQLNHRVEAVDQVESALICAAVVREVKGRLLRIHFDGWSDDYDQWMDAESLDLYPVGWCRLMGYPLSGPKGGELSENVKPKSDPTRSPATRMSAHSISEPIMTSIKIENSSSSRKRKKTSVATSAGIVAVDSLSQSCFESEMLNANDAKRQRIGNKKTVPVQEIIPVSIASHEEVKAEAIMLGKNIKIGSREKIKAALEKLKLNIQPPAPKKQSIK